VKDTVNGWKEAKKQQGLYKSLTLWKTGIIGGV